MNKDLLRILILAIGAFASPVIVIAQIAAPERYGTVNRLIDGKVLNTTRKFTNERGEYRFGGWAGRDSRERVNYEITVETESFNPKAKKINFGRVSLGVFQTFY